MIVFVTLAANELINSNAEPKHINTKIANSAVRIPRQIDQDILQRNKLKMCMDIWKALIPTISIVFIITYFIICFKK